MKSYYERTLFQTATISRYQSDGKKYNARNALMIVADEVRVGMAKKTGTQSSIKENPGNVEITEYWIMHTLFSGIQQGDQIDIEGYGSYKAGKPYPVMDTQGIHHYEVILYERTDA